MTAGRPESTVSNATREAAMDWLLRLDAAPQDRALREAVNAWITADDSHARAWEQAQRAWQLVGEVPPRFVTTAPVAGPVTAPLVATRARRRRRQRFAAAALAACLLLALLPAAMLHVQADHRAGIGASRQVALQDGSTMHLGAASAASVSFDAAARRITLLRGEAFFDVARDTARPFVVRMDDLDVRVLGTAFNLRRGDDAYTVGVQRGAVRVQYQRYGQKVDVQLLPGEELAIQSAQRVSRHAIPPQEVGAWREGRLFVQDATVADVISVLQRHQHARIAVVDGELSRARVTGVYDLSDPQRALRALVAPQGGHVRQFTPLLQVVSSR